MLHLHNMLNVDQTETSATKILAPPLSPLNTKMNIYDVS